MNRPRYVFDVMMGLWPVGRILYRLGDLPVLGPLLRPCLVASEDEALIIPVHQAVQGAQSVVLPYALLTPLVERSSHRTILHECLCRRGERCQTYPRDIGCLLLGEGAAAIGPERGHPAQVDEALAHIERAVESRLVPLIVHTAFDTWLLDIPFRRMLAVCFCCDCYCAVRHGLRTGPPAFWDTVVRLPGLSVTVGPGCTGCGACLSACHVGAITLSDGRSTIADRCKGCGRCITVCPNGAIEMHLEGSVDILGRLLARIEQRTNIGLAQPH